MTKTSMEIYEYGIELFDLMPLDTSVRSFICEALDAVNEEIKKNWMKEKGFLLQQKSSNHFLDLTKIILHAVDTALQAMF